MKIRRIIAYSILAGSLVAALKYSADAVYFGVFGALLFLTVLNYENV